MPILREVLCLARSFSGAEVESSIEPKRPHDHDMRASIRTRSGDPILQAFRQSIFRPLPRQQAFLARRQAVVRNVRTSRLRSHYLCHRKILNRRLRRENPLAFKQRCSIGSVSCVILSAAAFQAERRSCVEEIRTYSPRARFPFDSFQLRRQSLRAGSRHAGESAELRNDFGHLNCTITWDLWESRHVSYPFLEIQSLIRSSARCKFSIELATLRRK